VSIVVRAVEGGCELDLRIVPGASRDAVMGEHDGALKLRISAPPVDGAANDRLVRFLSKKVLGVRRSAVSLRRGEHGRSKTVFVRADAVLVQAAVDRALQVPGFRS